MSDKATDKPMLPLPLPGDVDLQDMPFMPLRDKRLMSSRAWLHAKNWRGGGPGLGFCLFNLWVEAFRAVPAGSLEDDDDMLADKARCDIDSWTVYKDKALRGWERHGGRVWHPVVCELAWELWLARLSAKHGKAQDSWRNLAKRAADKGNEPPDPPGSLADWIAANFPATAAYQAALIAAQGGAVASPRPADKLENPSDIPPKRSEDKVIPPLPPMAQPVDRPARGKERRTPADGKAWFVTELQRLENEFRPMLPVMLSELQQPGVAGKYRLVNCFKGCWIERAPHGKTAIVARSVQRARAIITEHGPWLNHYWPDLTVRHARVDELRARPAA